LTLGCSKELPLRKQGILSMSQLGTQPIARSAGGLDVYTGLLAVACLMLAAGIVLLAAANMSHSETREGANDGGMLTLVGEQR
jgi:hypothetical protein